MAQNLKNAMDLLDFGRVLADLNIIVAIVVAVDRLSARVRRNLL